MIVELGHRADGRARGAHRVGLVDRDRRRDAFDRVDLRLVHAVEELARVRREGLDVAPLAFGVQRVEDERRLAAAGHAGDDDELVRGQLERQVLEVVLARAADDDRRRAASTARAAAEVRRNRRLVAGFGHRYLTELEWGSAGDAARGAGAGDAAILPNVSRHGRRAVVITSARRRRLTSRRSAVRRRTVNGQKKFCWSCPKRPRPAATAVVDERRIDKRGIRLGVLDNSKGNADHLLQVHRRRGEGDACR